MGSVPRTGEVDVLLVEDEEVLAQMYRIKLVAEGFRVRIATDGPSGLAAAKAQLPDVLVLDIRLPVFDGLELLTRLRQDRRGRRVPVIVLSNYCEQETIDRGVELGALAHLIKSQTSPAKLVDALHRLVGARRAG